MIFPTGYDEDYQYREDIMKPNQAVDPRRQAKLQHTNHDRAPKTTVVASRNPPVANGGCHPSHQKLTVTSNGLGSSTHECDRADSQYAGLVESQL